jgi:reactive intermediate/imine deaminase
MKKTALSPKGVHAPIGDWSHAFKVEGKKMLFVSGQIPLDGSGNLVGRGDLRAQVKQELENMKLVLEEGGASFSNVVKLNTYLRNFEDFQKHWHIRRELYPQYFPDGVYPPATVVVVTSLYSEDVLVEIEAVAVID